MPRERKRITRPVQRPQNMGQNRNVQMNNNARLQQNRGFQGGLSQGGLAINEPPPGIQKPGDVPVRGRENDMKCPVGQKPGRGPNGKMTCVPDTQGAQGRPAPAPGGGGRGPGGRGPGGGNTGY